MLRFGVKQVYKHLGLFSMFKRFSCFLANLIVCHLVTYFNYFAFLPSYVNNKVSKRSCTRHTNREKTNFEWLTYLSWRQKKQSKKEKCFIQMELDARRHWQFLLWAHLKFTLKANKKKLSHDIQPVFPNSIKVICMKLIFKSWMISNFLYSFHRIVTRLYS